MRTVRFASLLLVCFAGLYALPGSISLSGSTIPAYEALELTFSHAVTYSNP